MSDAIFIHYVVCPSCRRQLRIGNYGYPVITSGQVVVGVRCCGVVWVNQGVAVGAIKIEGASVAVKIEIAIDPKRSGQIQKRSA